MAFNKDRFHPVGAQNRFYDGCQVFAYSTLSDTLADVKATGYFDDLKRILSPEDTIFVWATDGHAVIYVDETGSNITSKDQDIRAVPQFPELEAPVYDDYLTSGLSLGTGASAPNLTVFRDGLEQNAFAGSGPVEEAFFNVHMLHGLKAGTDLTFHIHWSHIIGSPSGDVKWGIEYSVARGYEVGVYPASTTLTTVHTAGAQYTHHITDDDDMTVTSGVEIEPDSVIICRVFRDSSDVEDTFANDAYLFQIDMHYQRGSVGTLERNRPFTSAGF